MHRLTELEDELRNATENLANAAAEIENLVEHNMKLEKALSKTGSRWELLGRGGESD